MKHDMKKVISSTGKVHLAHVGAWKNENVDPVCNYMSWYGDYWGQPWKVLENQKTAVTCKNCLKGENS